MNLFLTSDGHFGHENIIKYANRPFETAYHMGSEMINRWNSKVGPKDTVIYLGDFCLGNGTHARNYFRDLNGTIIMLQNKTHHDKRWLSDKWDYHTRHAPVKFVDPIYRVDAIETIVCCHFPIYVWENKHYGAWHAYGHIHSKEGVRTDFGINVGVDHWDYYPVEVSEIEEVMRIRGWYEEWNEFEGARS